MPHALLLSPDDQAVTAITGVLEEMSVTCERPLDGVSAAQKLNSQTFDLVLVDCENLPAAKLIFDVCRRGKNGSNPVPIAIVDGRAGLPTAFRLGAELILTKPVAKDQARGTIRTAVGRVRKHVHSHQNVSAHASSAASFDAIADSPVAQEHALAAAVIASSPGTIHSALDQIDAPASSPAAFANSHTRFPLSDDPVLAELDKTELEEFERAQSKAEASKKAEEQKQDSTAVKTVPDLHTAKRETPVSSPAPPVRQNQRGPLLAFLMLVLTASGFYAAWTSQPAFRAILQPQVDRLFLLVGASLPSTLLSAPAKPSAQPAQAPAAQPAASSAIAIGPNLATRSDVPASLPATSATTAVSASVPAQPPATHSPIVPVGAGTQPPALSIKPAPGKIGLRAPTDISTSDTRKEVVTATSPTAPQPAESSAIILSSKGAEARLIHSITPKYPADARIGGADGTVVLKAVVDENGAVQSLLLVEGNAALATAATEAVKQWRYRPYLRDGKALPFQTVIIVDFQRP